MNGALKLIASMAIFLILLSGVNACSINLGSVSTELRSTGDYYSSISAAKSQDIDIRINFNVDSYTGSDCPSNITAKAIVSRYNNSTGNWDSYLTTSSKTLSLSTGSGTLNWDNAFNTGTNTNYTRFRVEGVVLNGSSELQREEAFVDVQDNSCTGIKINTSSITINEGTTTTKTFTIQNTTDAEFSVSNMDIFFTTSLIKSGSVDYDSPVGAHTTRNITLTLDSGYVSSNQTVTGTLSVAGTLDNTTCSQYDIGRKNFSVTVQNTGSSDNGSSSYSTTSSSDCSDISLVVRDFQMDESSEAKVAFSVQNDSTKRFEITDVQLTSNGVQLSNYYNEKYVFSGQVADIIVKAISPNVTQDKTYNNSIKVRGTFTDGRSCSFSDIDSRTFNTVVTDNPNTNTTSVNCSNFSISAPTQVSAQNFGVVPISISNGTNQKATIYVEGTINADPSLIILPANTSISREITFSITGQNGEINFRPVISGCYPSTVTTQVTNTVNGALSQLSIKVTQKEDQNTGNLVLSLEINNPTNKVFSGVLNSTVAGYNSVDKIVNALPGITTTEVILSPNGEFKTGEGKITFQAEGQKISTNLDSSKTGALAGLFALGGNIGGLAILLLVIIAVIVIAGLIIGRENPSRDHGQHWVNKNKDNGDTQ